MCEKVIFFPYTETALPIVRHFSTQQSRYQIYKLIAWHGNALAGRDAAFICNQPAIGISVTDSFDAYDPNWNTLIVDCSSLENDYVPKDVEKIFLDCLKASKQILLISSRLCDAPKWLVALQLKYKDQVKALTPDIDIRYGPYGNWYSPLSVPLIMVGGLVESTDSCEIILSLREQFINDGYSVSCVTKSSLALLLGGYSYSHIFTDIALQEEEKALALNQFFNSIAQIDRPDLIIIEAPDAMLKFSNTVPNGFGIKTYILSQSLDPELCICCLPQDLVEGGFIECISRDFQSRYGMSLIAVHKSNLLVDSANILQERKISYVRTDGSDEYDTEKENLFRTVPVFDAIFPGVDKLYKYVRSLIC